MCVEKGWPLTRPAPTLAINQWETIKKDADYDVSQPHHAFNDIVLDQVKSRYLSNNNNNMHSMTRPQFFTPVIFNPVRHLPLLMARHHYVWGVSIMFMSSAAEIVKAINAVIMHVINKNARGAH